MSSKGLHEGNPSSCLLLLRGLKALPFSHCRDQEALVGWRRKWPSLLNTSTPGTSSAQLKKEAVAGILEYCVIPRSKTRIKHKRHLNMTKPLTVSVLTSSALESPTLSRSFTPLPISTHSSFISEWGWTFLLHFDFSKTSIPLPRMTPCPAFPSLG